MNEFIPVKYLGEYSNSNRWLWLSLSLLILSWGGLWSSIQLQLWGPTADGSTQCLAYQEVSTMNKSPMGVTLLPLRIPWWPWKLPILQVNVDCCYSVAKSCLTLCNPMDYSTPGFPVHHHLLEFAQNHVHWVSDAIQPSHPLSPPSPPAFSLSQYQGLFKWVQLFASDG